MKVNFTRVEVDVLQLLAAGRTSKEIAAVLQVSVHTVANHRKHICRKLGAHSTAELVARAVEIMGPGLEEGRTGSGGGSASAAKKEGNGSGSGGARRKMPGGCAEK